MITAFEERLSDSPFIESVWRADIEGSGTHTLPAKGRWDIIFMQRSQGLQTLLVGPTAQAVKNPYRGENAEYIGVKFKIGVFIPPLHSYRQLHTVQVLDTSAKFLRWVEGSIIEIPRYDTIEHFVEKLVQGHHIEKDEIVESVLGNADPSLSLRSIQRRFLRTTGLTPQHIRQINRAHEAATLLQQGVTATRATYELEYADQSHLTKSLRRIMGVRPSDILRTR